MKKNWQVILLISVLLISALSIYSLGLQYGIDLEGGTSIQLQLEREATDEEMETVVKVLNERLNSLGIKDIQVNPHRDNRHVTVEVAGTGAEEQNRVEEILKQEGVFIAQFNGETFAEGSDILRVNEIRLREEGKQWTVPFDLSQTAAEKFAGLAEGKPEYPVDMFVDPPQNSIIIASQPVYELFDSQLSQGINPEAPNLKERLSRDLNIDILNTQEFDESEFNNLMNQNKSVVYLGSWGSVSQVANSIDSEGFEVMNRTFSEGKLGENELVSYIKEILGLQGPYSIDPGLAEGRVSQSVSIRGSSPNRAVAANDAQEVSAILQSGSLPIETSIVRTYYVTASLGEEFRRQIMISALAAMIVIAGIIYARYRDPKISAALVFTSLSEIFIILGVASIISWNLDLPSIAGIITAIGTGVDQQIVMTDETFAVGEAKGKRRLVRLNKSINRALFILIAAAITTVIAMAPLAILGLGVLKGFAITTIIGVTAGITITRPAYGQILKSILR